CALKAFIVLSRHYKSTRYISSKDAATELQADLGHDFIDFLGYNPLLPSIEVHLKAGYMQTDSVAQFEREITRYHMVKEMFYQRDLVSIVNDNVRKISFWLMGFGTLTLLIAILLINNTMRLLIYSKRFTINTMQLVGATAGFIRRPFLLKSLMHGFIGAGLAVLSLAAGLFYLHGKVPEVISRTDLPMIIGVFVLLFALGLLITLISAYFSVNKYVRMRNSDRIYN
ncbi:MAG: permease-like cell division protein FtsX, partial [Bacteroidales bacterium]|nr:permease-like cell division protein FtsX [Bacteroidales bacterium]